MSWMRCRSESKILFCQWKFGSCGGIRGGGLALIDGRLLKAAVTFLLGADYIGFACSYSDVLESDLSAEIENGRIVRLLTKLGFINERAE